MIIKKVTASIDPQLNPGSLDSIVFQELKFQYIQLLYA